MAEEALLLLGWSDEGEPQGPCFPDTGLCGPASAISGGRERADSPHPEPVPGSGYQAQRTRGSVWLCPWLAGAVTSGYLSPRTELQFPYLENKEINT